MPGFDQPGQVDALFSFFQKPSSMCLTIFPHTPHFCALVTGLRSLVAFFHPPPPPIPVPPPGGSHWASCSITQWTLTWILFGLHSHCGVWWWWWRTYQRCLCLRWFRWGGRPCGRQPWDVFGHWPRWNHLLTRWPGPPKPRRMQWRRVTIPWWCGKHQWGCWWSLRRRGDFFNSHHTFVRILPWVPVSEVKAVVIEFCEVLYGGGPCLGGWDLFLSC